jgi:hypothetical protein
MGVREVAAGVNVDMAKGLKSKTIWCMAVIGGIGAGLHEYYSPAAVSGAIAQTRQTQCMQVSGFVRTLLVRNTGMPQYLRLAGDKTADLFTVVDVTTDDTDGRQSLCSASLTANRDLMLAADAKVRSEFEAMMKDTEVNPRKYANDTEGFIRMTGSFGVTSWLGTGNQGLALIAGATGGSKRPFEYRVWRTDEGKTMVQITEKPQGM